MTPLPDKFTAYDEVLTKETNEFAYVVEAASAEAAEKIVEVTIAKGTAYEPHLEVSVYHHGEEEVLRGQTSALE